MENKNNKTEDTINGVVGLIQVILGLVMIILGSSLL